MTPTSFHYSFFMLLEKTNGCAQKFEILILRKDGEQNKFGYCFT